jgi:hypothetical protein
VHKILHRVNTKQDLLTTPIDFGVEIDIRSNGDQLYLCHDPFSSGDSLEEWLELYNHGTLILNVKEEGLEDRLIELMQKFSIDDYFFLDQSFPFLIKSASKGENKCAVRVSEFENIETAMKLSGKIDWVWVDCFTRFPLTAKDAKRLQIDGGFKLCFVSPELQGRMDIDQIKEYRDRIMSLGIRGDAVCTKHPELWE